MATVRIPVPLRTLTANQRLVQADGATLQDLVEDLERQFPGIRGRLLDGDGRLHPFVNIFVDDQDVRLLQGLRTPVLAQSDVSIIPAMAGGARGPGEGRCCRTRYSKKRNAAGACNEEAY